MLCFGFFLLTLGVQKILIFLYYFVKVSFLIILWGLIIQTCMLQHYVSVYVIVKVCILSLNERAPIYSYS